MKVAKLLKKIVRGDLFWRRTMFIVDNVDTPSV